VAEDTPEGAAFGGPVGTLQDAVIDAEGKVEVGGGFDAGIIMTLHSNWYVEFWDGAVLGTVKDGNVSGGKDSRPVRCAVGSSDTALQLGLVGGTIVATGSGVTEQDKDDIADKVLQEAIGDHDSVSGSLAEYLSHMQKVINNKKVLEKTGDVWYLIIYDDNGVDEIVNKAIKDKDGNDITDLAAGVLAQELASTA